jgi:predicted regulator of amino acid metabolism with ACT domain
MKNTVLNQILECHQDAMFDVRAGMNAALADEKCNARIKKIYEQNPEFLKQPKEKIAITTTTPAILEIFQQLEKKKKLAA